MKNIANSKRTALVAALVMVGIAGVAASQSASAGNGVIANSTGSLLLVQKCSVETCPTLPGPWSALPNSNRVGSLSYSLAGPNFAFSFLGKNLTPRKEYTLIYYPDPWPGNDLSCLASGTANPAGNITLSGQPTTGNLPKAIDANFKGSAPGAKIWLVPTNDVLCNSVSSKMTGWHPEEILFEYNPIVYVDTTTPQ